MCRPREEITNLHANLASAIASRHTHVVHVQTLHKRACNMLSSAHSASEEVTLLLYDNHFDPKAAPKPTDVLYRSATSLGVPFRVGSLAPASTRPWSAGDREEWLLQVLPRVDSKIVVLLDASDAVLFCRASELAAKWHALAGRSANGRGRVLIGVEQQLWPEEQFYTVSHPSRPRGTRMEYPKSASGHIDIRNARARERVGSGMPFRYINIGMLAGPPADVHGLLRCMQQRYPGFPRQCPGGRHADGTFEFYSNAPHKTRFGIFAGHWGWEQSCFHNYFFEQTNGHLPKDCPEIALDYRAEVIVNLKKTLDFVILDWDADRPVRPRFNSTWVSAFRDVEPCVLHANSATKAAMPVLHLFWERMRLLEAGGAVAPVTERDVKHVVGEWVELLGANKTAHPCVLAARGAGLREDEAVRACARAHTVGMTKH